MTPRKKKVETSPLAPILGYVQLVRPLNGILSMVGVLIGYMLAWGGFIFSTHLIFALLSVFCISSAGQAINDYFDYEIDLKRKNDRPLARGLISRKMGLIFSLALFTLGIILASYLNDLSLFIAAFFSLMLILYSAVMQKIKFVGNVVVALGTAFTFIFGASVVLVTPLVLMIALSAFFANWTREIIKDMEDVNEDRGFKQTLATLMKSHEVKVLAAGILLIGILTSYLPTFTGLGTKFYLLLITLANVVFILAIRQFFDDEHGKAATTLKQGMIVALLAQLALLV